MTRLRWQLYWVTITIVWEQNSRTLFVYGILQLAFGESDPMPWYIRFCVCAIDLAHLVELRHGDTSRVWWTHQPFAADVNHDLAKGICRSLREKVFGGNCRHPLRRAHLYGILVYSIKNDNLFAFVRHFFKLVRGCCSFTDVRVYVLHD